VVAAVGFEPTTLRV